jgi:hypothetical protein
LAQRVRSRDRLRAEFDRDWRALNAESLRVALFRALSGARATNRAPRRDVLAA